MPRNKEIKKVLVIGSGPIVIGQAAEFDYAGTQACRSLKEEGIEVVLLNSNPATIMTDKDIADRVYIEPLTAEVVEQLILKERPDSVLPTLGGQAALNLAMELEESGFLKRNNVRLIGTTSETIKKAEDRLEFKTTMEKIGEPCAASLVVENVFHKEDCQNELPFEDMEAIREDIASKALAQLRILSSFGALVLDTETTGLSSSDRIIELSIIDMREGQCIHSSLYNPGFKLKPEITKLTGITDEEIEAAPVFTAHEARGINEITENRTVCAWNSGFDIRMLNAEFQRTGQTFKYRTEYDLMPLFARALKLARNKIKLSEAMKLMGIMENQDHRSLSDCINTRAVINRLLEKTLK